MSLKSLLALLVFVGMLAGCASPPPSLPDTPQRRELMERMFAKSTIMLSFKELEARAAAEPGERKRQVSADEAVASHKKQMNVDLPAAYWQQRRANLAQLIDARAKGEAIGLTAYKEKYFEQLSEAPTPMLAALADAPRMDALPEFALVLPNDHQLSYFYLMTVADETFWEIEQFYQHMADLDAQYGVCALYPDCYRPDFRTAKPRLPPPD
ncbi:MULTISPECIES: hypothetical protein [unclassified Pseudomonas]|jgi:hypothetical protein|uniref:hypothetical protein n=1 Tax=unclassified Pseudomonas TaxID=196821 RepID=UPI001320083F|nr:hypothetical protein [Pseudomonas sp. R84]QHC94958.1 hypothetical protein PspR84_09970 [Pseudomonas sp. R84]